MLSRTTRTIAAKAKTSFPAQVALRSFSSEETNPFDENATSALNKSCYKNIDWKVDADATVNHAIKIMTANRIGCLAVTEKDEVVGVFSERDFITKVAFMDKDVNKTTVREAATTGRANLVTVCETADIETCMEKMLGRDIRHLMITAKSSETIVGMISVKDVVKCCVGKFEAKVGRLEEIVQTQDMLNNHI